MCGFEDEGVLGGEWVQRWVGTVREVRGFGDTHTHTNPSQPNHSPFAT